MHSIVALAGAGLCVLSSGGSDEMNCVISITGGVVLIGVAPVGGRTNADEASNRTDGGRISALARSARGEVFGDERGGGERDAFSGAFEIEDVMAWSASEDAIGCYRVGIANGLLCGLPASPRSTAPRGRPTCS